MFHHKKKHLLSFLTIFHDAGEAVTKKNAFYDGTCFAHLP
jgi:hypothetical protein